MDKQSRKKQNGGSDLLTEALRQAFADAAEGELKPMRRDLSALDEEASKLDEKEGEIRR